MIRGIVGYSGFVGLNLQCYYKFDYFYNSKNFKEASNMYFDEIYFCGIPSVKWYANKNPEEDTTNIENIKNILKTIKIDKFFLISTIDVYNITNGNINEDYQCSENNHTYGKNRYLFEEFIKTHFKNNYIIRLPALFGYGLKKNILFDLINNNEINKIGNNTIFQWYSLNWLFDDIENMINNNIRLCNFFTEPIHTKDILKYFNYQEELYNNTQNIIYDLKTKYSKIFNCSAEGYIRNKEDVEKEIVNFINYNNINKENLCVSNICVSTISQIQLLSIIKVLGIKNIELAPTKLISWNNLNNLNLNIYKNNNIKVYSLQSITYGLIELNIFDSNRDLLLNHLKTVIDCAFKNKIKILVFGSPKNRKILDNNYDNNLIFINFFKELGKYCENKDVIICIEPNSKKYDCNFINTIDEAMSIILKINCKNIKLMIDLGNIIMENDDIQKILLFKDYIEHIHISQDFMKDFRNPNIINYSFSKYLNENINYNKILTLEMLIDKQFQENEISILVKSLLNFINIYGKK